MQPRCSIQPSKYQEADCCCTYSLTIGENRISLFFEVVCSFEIFVPTYVGKKSYGTCSYKYSYNANM
jgi:hypothetical protein